MSFDTIQKFIKNKRNTVQSDYHARVGREWRILGEPDKLHAPLSYSAFEFRIAMERCLLELLYLIKNKSLSDKELKYDIAQIKKALYKSQGPANTGKNKLTRRMNFNSIYQKNVGSQMGWPKNPIAIVDVDKVVRFWNNLSKYCHRQLNAENTWGNPSWVNNGYELLNEIEIYIWEIMVNKSVGWLEPDSLPSEIQKLASDYVEEKIDETSLDIRLRIMLPTLQMQNQL